MPIKYIGRTTYYKGKTLWEIVGNLKNYGIGRIIAKGSYERYPEPCFMKIVKVETLPNPEVNTPNDPRKVAVWVEKTFRGRTVPGLVKVLRTSYKADFILIPKDQEEQFCKIDKPAFPIKILPKTMPFPPLLKELVIRDLKLKGENSDNPQMPVVYGSSRESFYRVAEEGETPTVEVPGGLGKPVSPSLYKGLNI